MAASLLHVQEDLQSCLRGKDRIGCAIGEFIMSWHTDAIEKIRRRLGSEYLTKSMYLPEKPRERALYKPDIVVIKKSTDKMVAIIEVQTSRVRKSICGAAILANTVISKSKRDNVKIYDAEAKPMLYFVVQDGSRGRVHLYWKKRGKKAYISKRTIHYESISELAFIIENLGNAWSATSP